MALRWLLYIAIQQYFEMACAKIHNLEPPLPASTTTPSQASSIVLDTPVRALITPPPRWIIGNTFLEANTGDLDSKTCGLWGGNTGDKPPVPS